MYIPNLRKIAAALLLFLSATAAQAVPAYPRPVTLQQPDGTFVSVNLRGDENNHWMETSDGYTLQRDADGYLCFAQYNDTDGLFTTTVRYTGNTMRAKVLGLLPYAHQQAVKSGRVLLSKPQKAASVEGLSIGATFPTTGKRKLLVLLVNYSNTSTTYSPADFRRMMNEEGYDGVGSFRDYFLQQSYGKLDIDVTVTDWIKLPKSKGTYGADGAAYMIEDALALVTDTLDLSQFDNDGDGILDGLAVIHQGFGQEMSADANDIWSHSALIYGQKYNGISVRRYTIEPEMLATGNRMSTIGVICHEFGHNLGAPDYYDTDYSESGGEFCGTGVWDLLGSGAWNGNYGTHPAGVNAFQKWVWGWTDPVALDADTQVSNVPAADAEPVAYRVETGTPGEYLIFENRQQSGTFDAALPGHGLIAYHVNENIIRSKLSTNDINATYPQGIYTVCSDAGVDPDSQTSSYGDVNGAGAPFPGLYGHTTFSDNSLPSMRSLDGRYAYRSIENVTEEDGLISFTFRHLDEPAKPSDFAAVASQGEVMLSWNTMQNADSSQPLQYNVYRSDELIGTTTTTMFTDTEAPAGKLLTYQVDAAYADGLLSHPVSTQIRVPANTVTAFTATEQNGNTVLAWDTDDVLTRVDLTTSEVLQQQDIYADEVEYANCYTPADLSTYVGATVKRIAFAALQGPSVISVKVRVWEGNADGTGAQIVSERTVKEFANGQLRDVLLTTPVTIQADHTYWFSVCCTSTNGTVSVPCSQADIIPARGNCMLTNGEFVPYDDAYGNFLVRATLSVPSTAASSASVPEIPVACNPETDLFYPLAFALYADGVQIGTTTGRKFTLSSLPAGTHTLGVTALFAGGNESTMLKATLVSTGVQSVAPDADSPLAFSTESGIRLSGSNATAIIFDAQGREVVHTTLNGTHTWPLAAGAYVVKMQQGGTVTTQKVVVK